MTRLPDSEFLHRLADLADRRAEIVMRELIGTEYPAHAILGEEFGSSGAGSMQWVLDPIDGTKPYDIIPIIPIIEKAGGVVTRFDGRRAETGGAILLSATPELHVKVLAILNG